jgi:MFS family permease
MLSKPALSKIAPTKKLAIVNIMAISNAFVWYLLAFNTLKELLSQQNATTADTLLVFGVNTGAIVIAGLLGSFLGDKFKNKTRYLYIWLASGILLSLIPLGLNILDLSQLTLISLIFGLYFGIGMPATMGYHSALTSTEGRARIGGLSFLIIALTFAIAGLVIFDNLIVTCIVLAVLRWIGLMVFHFVRGKEQPKPEMVVLSYRSIATNRSFILYFIPWCMFTLINYMTIPIQQSIFQTQASYQFFTAMENIVIAISAVFSGFIADKFGRKRLTIIGFIMLGIGYAMMGLFSANSSNAIWGNIIYIIADGIAWGIFYVLFVFTLWGDLAYTKASDKLYFLGALPFVTSYFMQMLLSDSLQGIDKTLIFSFASFFLFLAVLPLFYAPETLSEKLLKDRDLQSYVLNAKKKAAKETDKVEKKKKPTEDNQTTETESTETDASYEEAKKLAEKYY